MKSANPCLTFDGTPRKFQFCKSVFGGDFEIVLRFRDMGGHPPGTQASDLDRIVHIALPCGKDDMLMASDILPSQGHTLTVGNNFHTGAGDRRRGGAGVPSAVRRRPRRDAAPADLAGREVRHVSGPVRCPVDGQLRGQRAVPGRPGNAFLNPKVSALTAFASSQTSSAASMVGKIRGNTNGTSGVALSGSRQGGGVQVTATGAATVTLGITNNTIRNWGSKNRMDIGAGVRWRRRERGHHLPGGAERHVEREQGVGHRAGAGLLIGGAACQQAP